MAYRARVLKPERDALLGSCAELVRRSVEDTRGINLIVCEQMDRSYLEAIVADIRLCERVIVVEDHAEVGGLGDAVRRVYRGPIEHIFLPNRMEAVMDSDTAMLDKYGFSPAALSARMKIDRW